MLTHMDKLLAPGAPRGPVELATAAAAQIAFVQSKLEEHAQQQRALAEKAGRT